MALVLERKVGESIYIGEGKNQVTVEVVGIDEGKVTLAFEAPKHVKILRHDAIARTPRERSQAK